MSGVQKVRLTPTQLVQFDALHADLLVLAEALKDDVTPPPPPRDCGSFQCVTSTAPAAFPLAAAGTKGVVRMALSPEVVRQLDDATEEALACEPDAPYRPIGATPIAELSNTVPMAEVKRKQEHLEAAAKATADSVLERVTSPRPASPPNAAASRAELFKHVSEASNANASQGRFQFNVGDVAHGNFATADHASLVYSRHVAQLWEDSAVAPAQEASADARPEPPPEQAKPAAARAAPPSSRYAASSAYS